jgi:hypothetical protein
MANDATNAPVQQDDGVERGETSNHHVSELVNLSSPQANRAVTDMGKSSLQNSEKLLNSWNNFSIDMTAAAHNEPHPGRDESPSAPRTNGVQELTKDIGASGAGSEGKLSSVSSGAVEKGAAAAMQHKGADAGTDAAAMGKMPSESSDAVAKAAAATMQRKSAEVRHEDVARQGQMPSVSSDAVAKGASAAMQRKLVETKHL